MVTIELPPLRERREDIPLLIEHFLKDLTARTGRHVQGISRAAKRALMTYDWPGNIRDLRNEVERALLLDTDGLIDVDDLRPEIAPFAGSDAGGEDPFARGADTLIGRPLSEVERYYIARALELCEGKRADAAKLLGMGERTLFRKIKEYDLK